MSIQLTTTMISAKALPDQIEFATNQLNKANGCDLGGCHRPFIGPKDQD